MGAVRMIVQTADKCIKIHVTPHEQLFSFEVKICVF